jgi:hypothetical protein
MLLLGMRSVTRSIPEELYSGGGIVVIMRSPCVLPSLLPLEQPIRLDLAGGITGNLLPAVVDHILSL